VLVREFVHLLRKKAAGVEVKVEVVGVAFIEKKAATFSGLIQPGRPSNQDSTFGPQRGFARRRSSQMRSGKR